MKCLPIIIVVIFVQIVPVTAQQSQPQSKCNYSGCVGDIKYSLLSKEDFRDINGDGWVLLQGQTLSRNADDELFSPELVTKFPVLPDATGRFVRSMNANGANGDPWSQEHGGAARMVGEYQDEEFKSHRHELDQMPHVGWNTEGNNGTFRIDADDGGSWGGTDILLVTNSKGGAETRPRNISLYLYVKIR